nr:unnamed protein product [Digitaria exilis]
MSQKNHVSADEVVSRPAMMKLITMSRIASSPYPAAAIRDTRSSPSPRRRARRRRMSSVMAPWITAISSRRRLSDPTPSARFAFHTAATGAAPRRATIAAAASNADASLDITGNNGVSSSHTAYDVERELPQELLHVDDGHGDLAAAGARRGVERREQARAGLGVERGAHTLPEGPGGELVADELALGAPRLTVDVEDAAAEEVAECLREGLPFRIVPKVTLEDVLDVRRVRGHHGASRAEAFHDERLRRRRREEAGVPVEQPATVPVELHQAAQHRVAPRRVPQSGANVTSPCCEQSMAEGAEEEEAGSHEW